MKIFQNFIAASLMVLNTALIVRAEDAHAFPNPFVAQQSTLGTVAFTPLPNSGTIKIYTIDGTEVRSLDIIPGGITSWDTKNSSGKNVASGVYYFHVSGEGQENIGKVVIIR